MILDDSSPDPLPVWVSAGQEDVGILLEASLTSFVIPANDKKRNPASSCTLMVSDAKLKIYLL